MPLASPRKPRPPPVAAAGAAAGPPLLAGAVAAVWVPLRPAGVAARLAGAAARGLERLVRPEWRAVCARVVLAEFPPPGRWPWAPCFWPAITATLLRPWRRARCTPPQARPW